LGYGGGKSNGYLQRLMAPTMGIPFLRAVDGCACLSQVSLAVGQSIRVGASDHYLESAHQDSQIEHQ
jgi:hypothetical protein